MKIEQIQITSIDEPQHAMRSDAWNEDIESLAKSIQQFGLLQPITIKRSGERYEVVAGHRRLLAYKQLGYPFIPSIVREETNADTDAMKVHENLYRADVNPVDQAAFLYEYMQRAGLTVSELAIQLNRSESWVQSRIQILSYPEYLIDFIGQGKLSMAAAEVLNQIPNELLREKYCRDAAIIGLSATRAKYWLAQSSTAANDPNNITIIQPPADAPPTERAKLMFRCTFDGLEYPAEIMMMVYVNPENLAAYEIAIKEAEQSRRYDTEGAESNEGEAPETARA